MILVTGGSGLVGQEVLRALAGAGRDTLALVRSDEAEVIAVSLGARVVRGAVEDPATWRQPLPALSGIVHSAAIIAQHVPWKRFQAVNVEGTRLACTLAEERDVPLVHISSVAVYGRRQSNEPWYSLREAAAARPLPAREYYARSKQLAETVVFEYADRGLKACALRPCVIYGPGDRLLLPRLLDLGRRGWFPLVGNGTRPMALVHAASVAQAVLAAFQTNRGWGRAFNTTGDARVTARDLLEAVADTVGRRVRPLRLPAGPLLLAAGAAESALRLMGPRRYPGSLKSAVRFMYGGDPYDANAARNVLGWKPTFDAGDALRSALEAVARRT